MTTEKFHYKTSQGDEIEMPRMGKIKGKLLRRVRKLDGVDGLYEIIEEVGDQRTNDILDELDAEEVLHIFELWQKDGPAGESGGSSS